MDLSMMSTLRLGLVVAALAAGALCAPAVDAASDAAWKDTFDAFAQADQRSAPQPGGVLFVGSSSIRLWPDLDRAFDAGNVVLNRGFGGSQLSDCVANVDRLVIAYRPRLVFLYAGDNDLAAGVSPEVVVERLRRFVARVREALPETRIVYISIKPSPARASLLPVSRQANRLIEQLADEDPTVDFVDVFTPMLDASGQPREELFQADRLHMNARGYALWKAVIGPLVH